MPLIQITEKNKDQYGGLCVVINSHIHDKQIVSEGAVIIKKGMEYYEALGARLIRSFDPEKDMNLLTPEQKKIYFPKNEKQLSDAEANEIIANMEVDPPAEDEPKKLGPKKRKSKKE